MSALGALAKDPRWRAPAGFAVGAVLLFVLAPLLLSQFRLDLLAKYLCFGIVAVGIGLAWGRGGMLTLGQGVYFGLGAYAMAMHLKLAQTPDGELPDFMKLYGEVDTLPQWWRPFASPLVAVPATVLLPMAVAFLLGLLVFRRRVKGAYFAILSQALAAAMAILIVGQQGTTGGTNGLTDISSFFGYDLNDPVNRRMVYFITAGCLLGVLALARQLYRSRYGELLVAVRDAQERVRFLGYDPALVQAVAYSIAAGMAGLAGALFVSVVGAINPASIDIVPSIAFVIGVAVGGRTTLLGPALGAVAVAWSGSAISESFPDRWNYVQGGLFILVVAFLPGGIASLPGVLRSAWSRRSGVGPGRGGRGGGYPAGSPDAAQEPTTQEVPA